MTTEEIVEAARAAGFSTSEMMTRLPAFKRLIDSAAAAEREACADIVENANTPDCGGWSAQGIADDIRARGQK